MTPKKLGGLFEIKEANNTQEIYFIRFLIYLIFYSFVPIYQVFPLSLIETFFFSECFLILLSSIDICAKIWYYSDIWYSYTNQQDKTRTQQDPN